MAGSQLPQAQPGQEPTRTRQAAPAVASVHTRVSAPGGAGRADAPGRRGVPAECGDTEGPQPASVGQPERLPPRRPAATAVLELPRWAGAGAARRRSPVVGRAAHTRPVRKVPHAAASRLRALVSAAP